MILALFGTNPYPFYRLMDGLKHYVEKTGTQIIAQTGNTPVCADFDCRPYVDHSDLMDLIDQAEVVVCQGGYGSIKDCLSRNAKVVAVPRSVEYGECVDNQIELVRALESEGLVTAVYEIGNLHAAIEKAKIAKIEGNDASFLPVHVSETIRAMLEG